MSSGPDFVLKHRLVGAAVLIFFGALVLPWLLGPPSDQVTSSAPQPRVEVDGEGETQSAPFVAELLKKLAQSQLENGPDEAVYVSRITPLDEGQTQSSEPSGQAQVSTIEPSRVLPLETVETVATEPLPEDRDNTTSSEPVSPVPTEQTEQAITVGWIVQVGVFVDQSGAQRVVDNLSTQGFSPRTTTVDTNRGPRSGTRVWLGPFETRVDAAKAKALLTESTGERGFIRSYP